MDTLTLSNRINAWSASVQAAQDHFAAACGSRPTDLQIQQAACFVLGIDDKTDLLDREWTDIALIDLLKGVDFAAWNDVETITFASSILPTDILRRADEETIKFRGEVWVIHKYDPDPFPSIPHAHCEYEGIKMDLRDGSLYHGKRFLKRLSKKRLVAFRALVRRIELPAPTI